MFPEERRLPIRPDQLDPLDRSFRQEPINVRLPIGLQAPSREVIIVNKPDYTPALLGLFAFFALILFGIVVLKK